MAQLRMRDISAGSVVVTQEYIGDDRSNMELREVYYLRDPDRKCRYTGNVPLRRIGCFQGSELDPTPRYARAINPSTAYLSEASGAMIVKGAHSGRWRNLILWPVAEEMPES